MEEKTLTKTDTMSVVKMQTQVDLENIDALFQKRYENEIEEVAVRNTPYFLSNTCKSKISKRYSIPIYLKTAHSIRYAENGLGSNYYPSFSQPVIEEAKAEVMSKFFKVGVPLNVVQALNETEHNNSLAYATARYFIDVAIKNNALLAELSYMYGESGLPNIVFISNKFKGEALEKNEVGVVINKKNSSDTILKLIDNAFVSILNETTDEVQGAPAWNFEVCNYDSASSTLKLMGDENHVEALKNLDFSSPYSLRLVDQHTNDTTGIYDLLTKNGFMQGIDSNKHSNWEPSNYSMGNKPITLRHVKEAVSKLVAAGCIENEDISLYVSHDAWNTLTAEVDENNLGKQSFRHSNGLVEVKYHPLMKENTAFLMTDITNADNLVTLTTGDVLSFNNDKKFIISEDNSYAYVIGELNFLPFMRNRKKHMAITEIG